MSERDAAVDYLHLLILKHTPSHHINLYYHVPLILKSGTPPFFAPFGPIFYSFIARYFGIAFSFLIWVLMHARRFTDSTLYDMASEWFGHFFVFFTMSLFLLWAKRALNSGIYCY